MNSSEYNKYYVIKPTDNVTLNNNAIFSNTYENMYDLYNIEDKLFIYASKLDSEILEMLKHYNHIIFSDRFNGNIDNLPNNIMSITFDYESDFNHPINNLPYGLTFLLLNCYFNQPLDNLPITLKYLFINNFYLFPLDNLPYGLKYLSITDYKNPINNLPITLEELHIFGDICNTIDNLPDSIKILKINGEFNQPINKFPESLEKLFLYGQISYVFPTLWTTNLKTIDFGYIFNMDLENIGWVNCENIREIYFGIDFNKKLTESNLPKKLEIIEVRENFNLIENIISLPKTLKKFKINILNCSLLQVNIQFYYNNIKKLNLQYPNIHFFINKF
jgi:hypothetical protein